MITKIVPIFGGLLKWKAWFHGITGTKADGCTTLVVVYLIKRIALATVNGNFAEYIRSELNMNIKMTRRFKYE